MPAPVSTEDSDVGVLVLAAGEGRRLGLGPKAHVRLGEETFLERVVRTSREAGLRAIWAVGSPNDALLPAACAALQIHYVLNPTPALGMSSSIHAGLAAALSAASSESPRALLIFPVDVPLVRASTLRALVAAEHTDACARPLHAGRHGHPILLGAALAARILSLGPGVPLRDALASVRAAFVDVAVDDSAALSNVNTPADLTAARRGA